WWTNAWLELCPFIPSALDLRKKAHPGTREQPGSLRRHGVANALLSAGQHDFDRRRSLRPERGTDDGRNHAAAEGRTRPGAKAALSRSIANMMVSSLRPVATMAFLRRSGLPRQMRSKKARSTLQRRMAWCVASTSTQRTTLGPRLEMWPWRSTRPELSWVGVMPK